MKLNRKTLRRMILNEIREFSDKPMSKTQMHIKQTLEDFLKEKEVIGFYGQDIGKGAFGHSYNPGTGGFDFTLGGRVIYSIVDATTTFSIPMLKHINPIKAGNIYRDPEYSGY